MVGTDRHPAPASAGSATSPHHLVPWRRSRLRISQPKTRLQSCLFDWIKTLGPSSRIWAICRQWESTSVKETLRASRELQQSGETSGRRQLDRRPLLHTLAYIARPNSRAWILDTDNGLFFFVVAITYSSQTYTIKLKSCRMISDILRVIAYLLFLLRSGDSGIEGPAAAPIICKGKVPRNLNSTEIPTVDACF